MFLFFLDSFFLQDCLLPRLESLFHKSRFTPMTASMCSSATVVLSSSHLFAFWASKALAFTFLSIPLPLASASFLCDLMS
jgi:hypothetical protein